MTSLAAMWSCTRSVTARTRTKPVIEEKIDEKAALKKVAKEREVSKSEVYRELQRNK
jgi:hypothetical protein